MKVRQRTIYCTTGLPVLLVVALAFVKFRFACCSIIESLLYNNLSRHILPAQIPCSRLVAQQPKTTSE